MGKLLRNYKFWLLSIIVIGAILRFFQLSDYLQFLGDQGRDVLIVKRMIVDGKWTLLGPNASVGGFFTGPIYYYFMLPFLWIFRLDPVGPAVLSALIGTAMIALTFWFCRIFFNSRVGLLAAFLVAISPKMVDISRFSWNPNPVPFFSLLVVLFLYLAKIKNQSRYNFFTGITLGILVQLHYIDLVFIPIVGLSLLMLYPWRQCFFQGLLITLGFLLGDSLFLIFEARHGFPNLKSVWEFVDRSGATVSPRSWNPIWLVLEMGRRLYGMTLGAKDSVWEYVFLYFSLAGFSVWAVKTWTQSRPKIVLIATWLLIGLLGIGSYQGELHDHYFNYLYPLPFILLGISFDHLISRKWWGNILSFLGFSLLGYFAISNLYFWQPPNKMLDQIQEIDRTVLEFSDGQPYNLGLISSYNSDYSYRYFLEIWGRPPTTIENPDNDPKRETVTQRLIVICEDKKCEPLGHSRWEIAGFGRAEIVTERLGPAGIRIFKLVNYKG